MRPSIRGAIRDHIPAAHRTDHIVGRLLGDRHRGSGHPARPGPRRGRNDRRGAAVRVAWPRGSRVPHRPEVGGRRRADRRTAVSGVQRCRGRAGHLQGSSAAARQSVSTRRRPRDRSVRSRGRRGVHLPEGQLRARNRRCHPCRAGIPGGRHLYRLRGHHRGGPRGVPVR